MASNRIPALQDQKANLLRDKASTMEFISRLKQGDNPSQVAIQERNILRLEQEIARIEGEIAREMSR